MGNAVVLLADRDSWEVLFDSLEEFSDDFMSDCAPRRRHRDLAELQRDVFE